MDGVQCIGCGKSPGRWPRGWQVIDGVSWCAPCNKKYPVKDNGGGGGEDDDEDGEEEDDEEEEEEEEEDELVPYYSDLVRDGTEVQGPDTAAFDGTTYYKLDDTLYAVFDEVPRVWEDPVIIPGQELVAASMAVGGTNEGATAMLCLPDGRVLLVGNAFNEHHSIRMLSANLEDASTVAGGDESGYGGGGDQDGAAVQARFHYPQNIALLPDGRVLVADTNNCRLRLLSTDLQQVSTVAGDGEEGHQDGAAAQAQFNYPCGLAVLPGGRVLVADQSNHCIRMLSADLQQVSTVAGPMEGEDMHGHRNGAAAQALFSSPSSLALLPDGRVLVAEGEGSMNNCIRLLSADLQQVSTVAGDRVRGHRDGAAVQARFDRPSSLTVLPNGRVLLSDGGNQCIRVLSADLQEVSTLTIDSVDRPHSFQLLPDGRVLVASDGIRVLVGLVAASGPKPAAKKPDPKAVLAAKAAAAARAVAKVKPHEGGGAAAAGAPASDVGGVKRQRDEEEDEDEDDEDEQNSGAGGADIDGGGGAGALC